MKNSLEDHTAKRSTLSGRFWQLMYRNSLLHLAAKSNPIEPSLRAAVIVFSEARSIVFEGESKKSETSSAIGLRRLYVGDMLSIAHCVDNRLSDFIEVVSFAYQPYTFRRNFYFCLWYLFLLDAE
jgi:hypothetical protein